MKRARQNNLFIIRRGRIALCVKWKHKKEKKKVETKRDDHFYLRNSKNRCIPTVDKNALVNFITVGKRRFILYLVSIRTEIVRIKFLYLLSKAYGRIADFIRSIVFNS